MRQTLFAAAAAFMVGGVVTGAVLSQAQPAPPATQQSGTQQSGTQQSGTQQIDGTPPNHWMHMHHIRPFHRGDFALIYRQQDRQLAPADVQKIAEGFLLWNGNHTWKVTNVGASADGPVGFSLSTPEGSVVAKFTMDPHSGRIARVG